MRPQHFYGLTFDIFPSVCYKNLFEIEFGQDVLIDAGKSGEGVTNPSANGARRKNHKTKKEF